MDSINIAELSSNEGTGRPKLATIYGYANLFKSMHTASIDGTTYRL